MMQSQRRASSRAKKQPIYYLERSRSRAAKLRPAISFMVKFGRGTALHWPRPAVG
jgi:hypothetical protein